MIYKAIENSVLGYNISTPIPLPVKLLINSIGSILILVILFLLNEKSCLISSFIF